MPAQEALQHNAQKLPQPATDIELGVLAALCQFPLVTMPVFAAQGRLDFFQNPVNRTIAQRANAFFVANACLELPLFTQSLIDERQLDTLGGAAFITSLWTANVVPESFTFYLDILRTRYRQREVARLGLTLANTAANGALSDDDISTLLKNVSRDVATLQTLSTDEIPGAETFSHAAISAFDSSADPGVLLGSRRWLGKGYTCLWAGGSGYGKSTLQMQAALYWATGTALFGIKPVRPLKSLIVQAENDLGDISEQFQGVTRAIASTGDVHLNGQIETKIVIIRLVGASGQNFLSRLAALIKLHSPDLVWIDPLFAFAGCDLIDTASISHFLRDGLIPLCVATQVCCHVIHHIAKPARDNDSKKNWSAHDYQFLGFGSSEIQNAFRAVNILIPVSGAQGTFKLILSKRGERAGACGTDGDYTQTLFLRHSPDSLLWCQVDEPTENDSSRATYTLKNLLSEMSPLRPLHTKALQKHLADETGMSKATFYRLFDSAKENQKIRITDEGWVPC